MYGVRSLLTGACLMAAVICAGCVGPSSLSPWASTSPSYPAQNGQIAPNGLPAPSGAGAANNLPAPNAGMMPQGALPEMPPNASSGMNTPSSSKDPWSNFPAVAGSTPRSSAIGAGFGSSLLEATDLLADGVRIQPKVIPAPDPTKLDNRPSNPSGVASDLHYHAGRVFEGQNSLAYAAGHYRDALARNPKDVHLLISYARVQDRMGNFMEAEATYRQALELRPLEASTHNGLGLCYARQAKWDGAIQALNEAIRLQPANSLYRNNLALILMDTNRTEEAYQQLVAAHGEAGAHYNLGYLLQERNRADEARWHFAKALELNPYLEPARQMLAQTTPSSSSSVTAQQVSMQPSATQQPMSQQPSMQQPPIQQPPMQQAMTPQYSMQPQQQQMQQQQPVMQQQLMQPQMQPQQQMMQQPSNSPSPYGGQDFNAPDVSRLPSASTNASPSGFGHPIR